ncbi:hypothetical protein BLNAU_16207 [Blattamonas nauphoetae]|uniref:Right handed beta helix domain-containing protein n=1 Tax=Blattamonas nauphoetae TaxID=2049346 RepID=A0ABQ9XDB4_9EUKA|nr:hypothetical protein BLNAU_16207 [Blattamonas nauphoetae]
MEPEGGDFRQHLATLTTDGDGAFLHASSATVIIKNYAFGICHAQNGGSLFFQDCRDIKLSRCLFTDCSESGDGGSVFVENHNSPNASIVLEVCSFADCPAERGGGFLVSASAPSNGRLGSHSRSTAGYNHEGGCSECLVTIWIVLNTHKLSPSGEDGSAQTSLTFPPKHPSCCRHHFLLNGHFTTNPSMSSAPGSSPADAFCADCVSAPSFVSRNHLRWMAAHSSLWLVENGWLACPHRPAIVPDRQLVQDGNGEEWLPPLSDPKLTFRLGTAAPIFNRSRTIL